MTRSTLRCFGASVESLKSQYEIARRSAALPAEVEVGLEELIRITQPFLGASKEASELSHVASAFSPPEPISNITNRSAREALRLLDQKNIVDEAAVGELLFELDGELQPQMQLQNLASVLSMVGLLGTDSPIVTDRVTIDPEAMQSLVVQARTLEILDRTADPRSTRTRDAIESLAARLREVIRKTAVLSQLNVTEQTWLLEIEKTDRPTTSWCAIPRR